MARRHFTRVLHNSAYKCVSCRQEFSTREQFGKHCRPHGRCSKPWEVGLEADLTHGPYFWTKAA